jgi:hypothetical protein
LDKLFIIFAWRIEAAWRIPDLEKFMIVMKGTLLL